MNVSFDFDGTLSKKAVQDFARYCISEGLIPWIVTSRASEGMHESYNQDLWKVGESLGIDRSRIVFTNRQLKKDYFRQFPDYIFHLDDDWIELHEINTNLDLPAISCFGNTDWEQECFVAIQNYKQRMK